MNKKLKYITTSILLLVFVCTLFLSVSSAEEDAIFKVKLGHRDLNPKQIYELLKDPQKSRIRAEMDVQYLLDEAENEMNKASSQYSKQLKAKEVSAD